MSSPALPPYQFVALEAAVLAQATQAARLLASDEPWAVAEREDAADRVVDLLACRAWTTAAPPPGRVAAGARQCVAHVVAADAGRAGHDDGRSAAHRRVGDALMLLTVAAEFDAATRLVRELLSTPPEERLLAAWRTVDAALRAVVEVRHEWVGAAPGTVAAAGWTLVDRIGRLLTCAALVAQAAQHAGPSDPHGQVLVNAARRHAWNHLRGPAPEAATSVHVRRSADLLRSVVAPAAPWGGS
jgi:hypothetical protein